MKSPQRRIPRCLVIALLFASLSGAASPALAGPMAVLTDVSGNVQVVSGGKTIAGKSGTRLAAGDTVRVANGKATVYYVSRSPQQLKAGQQVKVGAAGASGTAPSVWRNVYASVSTGFSRRGEKRNATVREDQRVQLIAPVATKTLDARPTLLWTPPVVTDFLFDYQVSIKDAAGKQLWTANVKGTSVRYPASAPALLPGRRYGWSVTPRQTAKSGQPEAARELASDNGSFEVATAAAVAAANKEIAELNGVLKATPEGTRRTAIAAALTQRGFGAAALEVLLKETGAPAAATKFLTLDVAIGKLDEASWVLLRNLFLTAGRQTLVSRIDMLDKAGTALQEFERLDAARLATTPNTLERAKAAQAAMQAAAAVAWAYFDTSQSDNASQWFDRRGALRNEVYSTLLTVRKAAFEAGVEATAKALKEYQAATAEDAKTTASLQYETLLGQQVMRTNDLYTMAMQNNDALVMLEFADKQLALRHLQLEHYEREKAPDEWLLDKKADIANVMENRGGALEDLARYDEAEKLYNEALTMRRALPPIAKREISRALSSIGNMYRKQGDMAKARDFLEQALAAHAEAQEIVRKADEAETAPELKGLRVQAYAISRAMILNNLGNVASGLGDYQKTLAYYRDGLKVLDPLATTGFIGEVRASMRATALGNIATYQAETGDLDAALKGLNEVLRMRRELGEEETAGYTLLSMGGLYYEKGDTKETKRYIEQARRLFIAAQDLRGVISTTQSLSLLARHAKDIPLAAHYAQEALAMAQRAGDWGWIGAANRSLAAAYWEQKKYPEAMKMIAEAAAADTREGSPQSQASTLTWRGVVLEDMGENDEAVEAFKAAIELREKVRATVESADAFGDMKYNYQAYDAMVRLLVKLKRYEEAFDYLARARSKRMRDSLRLSSIKTNDKELQALLERAGSLESKLRTVEAELQSEQAKPEASRNDEKVESLKLVAADTQREFVLVSKRIRDANPNFDKILTVRPAELKQAQGSIPENTILVQYAPLGDQLYIFLVTHNSLKIYTPPVKPEKLEERIREFRGFIDSARKQETAGSRLKIVDWQSSTPAVAGLRANLTALHAMLIAPIEPELAGKDVIAFIPTGSLYYLPLHALASERNGKLRFLLEDKQVAYLSAADVMAIVQQHDPSTLGQGLTAYGNPTGAGLQHALEEVNTIAKVFPATQVLSGAQVTKTQVLAPQNLGKRFLHFATHGVLNARVPDQSYIQLAPGATPEDARLTVGEVYGLELGKVDLVTLSACQTALGERDPDGREITTLAEAFSTAGAQTVAASLWSVEDNSTKDLMVEFYSQLAAGKSKAAALQAAQLKVMKQPEYAHPYYWAAFVLMGDWR